MKIIRYEITIPLIILLLFVLTACGEKNDTAPSGSENGTDKEEESAVVAKAESLDFSATVFLVHFEDRDYAVGYEVHANVPALDDPEWSADWDPGFLSELTAATGGEKVKLDYDFSVLDDIDNYYVFDKPAPDYLKTYFYEAQTVVMDQNDIDTAEENLSGHELTISFHKQSTGETFNVSKTLPLVVHEYNDLKKQQ